MPALSVHAVTRLAQRRTDDAQVRGRTVSVTVQLAFALAGQTPARAAPALQPWAATSPEDCEPRALCEWAWLAEEATLTALGVAP